MSYEEIFNSWYEDHLKRRGGENKRRLMEGLGHECKPFLRYGGLPFPDSTIFIRSTGCPISEMRNGVC